MLPEPATRASHPAQRHALSVGRQHSGRDCKDQWGQRAGRVLQLSEQPRDIHLQQFRDFDGPAYDMGVAKYGRPSRLPYHDGISNTAMFSEMIRGKNDNGALQGKWQIYTINASASPRCRSRRSSLVKLPNRRSARAQRPGMVDQNTSEGGGYSHTMTPNAGRVSSRTPGPANTM